MPGTAPDTELEIESPEVNDDELADWGLAGIGEDDDEDETGSPEKPESDPAAAAAAAQVEDDGVLPGVAEDGTEGEPPPAGSPPAAAGRSAEEEPAAAAEEVRPYGFKADGKDVVVPRSQIFKAEDGEEYVLIPLAEAQRTLQPHFADRGAWREKEKGYLQTIAERDPEHNELVVQAKDLTEFVWSLFEKSDDEILKAIDAMKAGRSTWELEKKAQALEGRLKAREGVEIEPDAEQLRIQQEETEQAVRTEIREDIDAVLKEPEFAALNGDRMLSRLLDLRHKIYFEAAEDMPQFGLKKGDIGKNVGFIRQFLIDELAQLKEISERVAKGARVEQTNAAALRTPRKTAPAKLATPAHKEREEEEFDVDKFLNEDNDLE